MRQITILLTILLFCITLQAQDFGGSWGVTATENHDKDGTPSWGFSLMIWKNAGKYVGDYMYTIEYGDLIQTGDVKVLSIKGNKAKLQLSNTSGFVTMKEKKRICEVELLPNGKLFFNYSNAKKDYALPDSIFLNRTRTEKELIEIRKQQKNQW